jgi:murein DD-endopeptidase MepM/ murein hydrolase activator NlpD
MLAAPMSVQVELQGPIEPALAASLGAPAAALSAQVVRLLNWQGNVGRDVRSGDRLVVWYEGEPATVQALHYQGEKMRLRATLFEGRYYQEEGNLVEPWLLQNPVPTWVQITEGIQKGRGRRRHDGIDIKAERGEKVLLPYGGVVTRRNWGTRVNGRCLEVRYSEGPARGHLARFLHLDTVGGKGGQRLRAGAMVGTVGSTGRSSAPHLHYEIVRDDGRVLDPLEVHGTRVHGLEHEALQRFHAALVAFAPP